MQPVLAAQTRLKKVVNASHAMIVLYFGSCFILIAAGYICQNVYASMQGA
jgi:hypothetical protein